MSPRRAIIAVSAALSMMVALGACGGASSSASSGVITAAPDPTADVSAAAANPVTVSPLPGTEDASPPTQISFLGGRGNAGLRRARGGIAQRRAQRPPGGLLDRHRRELPALAPVRARRAGDRARARLGRRRRPEPSGEHQLQGRSPRRRSARRSSPTTPATPATSSTTPRRPTLTPSTVHDHHARRRARRERPATCSSRPTRARARRGR